MCGIIVYNDLCILQTNKRDEKTGFQQKLRFQCHRNGVKDRLLHW